MARYLLVIEIIHRCLDYMTIDTYNMYIYIYITWYNMSILYMYWVVGVTQDGQTFQASFCSCTWACLDMGYTSQTGQLPYGKSSDKPIEILPWQKFGSIIECRWIFFPSSPTSFCLAAKTCFYVHIRYWKQRASQALVHFLSNAPGKMEADIYLVGHRCMKGLLGIPGDLDVSWGSSRCVFFWISQVVIFIYTLWLLNIAVENGP